MAEDDALVGHAIRRELEKIGVAVVGWATDGRQAVEMVKSLRPEVVLMDVEMPEMDGLDAARQIQETCPTPIVVLTVYTEKEMVARAASVGVGAYLIKPPKAVELERAIAIAVARFEDLRALRRLNDELQRALEQVKTLRSLLPICAGCKKIRDDGGYWHQVEVYIRDHAGVQFTHGICPDCMVKYYSDYGKE